MEYYIAILFSFYLLACIDAHYTKEEYCPKHRTFKPKKGGDSGGVSRIAVSVKHGDWKIDYKNGYRCILKCDSGFEPSDCHVIRRDKHGHWKRNIPTCVEESTVSGKTLAAIGVGTATVVAAPYALAAAGFGAAGVAAGSFAAWFQGPATAAGSWFALGQSAGAAGIAASTQAGIFSSVTTATRAVSELFSGCESE